MVCTLTLLFLYNSVGVSGQNYTVTIVANPDMSFYAIGNNLMLTCMVTPAANDDNATYMWSCPTCFADGSTMQTVSTSGLVEMDGDNMINCFVTIGNTEYMSDVPFDLQVTQGTYTYFYLLCFKVYTNILPAIIMNQL